MRLDDKKKFEYLLNRGLLPSSQDSDGSTVIHYAIRMEKLDFLSFLFEGDYLAFENILNEPLHLQQTLHQSTLGSTSMMNKSYM